jgi:hypothetical protein
MRSIELIHIVCFESFFDRYERGSKKSGEGFEEVACLLTGILPMIIDIE